MKLKEIRAMIKDRSFWVFFKETFNDIIIEGMYDNQYTKTETTTEALLAVSSLLFFGVGVYFFVFQGDKILSGGLWLLGLFSALIGTAYGRRLENKYHRNRRSNDHD